MAENELQKLINGIFSRIKEKYGYTDEQALIYLQGYQDCAEENQKSLEKRDKMLRDAVTELCEAKRLLKLAVEDFETIESNLEYDEHCVIKTHSIRCDECPLSAATIYRCKWRHADEALKLIEG
jgi:hypothetical protein